MAGITLNASKQDRKNPNAQPKIQDDVKTPVYRERTTHLPAKRVEELKKLYSHVAVRDFGDSYHKSQSELEKENQFAVYQRKIASHKTRYNNIVQYIKAMRTCIEFIQALAEAETTRLAMKPKEFIKGVLNGEITVSGFLFPKYKGRDRKDIDWKTVTEYVIDTSKDPNDLIGGLETDVVTESDLDNPDDAIHKYFTKEQLDYLFNMDDTQPESLDYVESIDGFKIGAVTSMSKKDFNKLSKLVPEIQTGVREFRKRKAVNDSLRDFAYELDRDAFEYISDLDEKRGFLTGNKIPRFEGSLLNKDDYKRHLYRLSEYEERNTRVNYAGKYITLEDYREETTKEVLDSCGWNVTKLYGIGDEMKKRKKANKADEKKAKRLKKELTRIKKRQDKRNGVEGSAKVNSKKKKVKKTHKSAMKKLDHVISSSSGEKGETYKDYENRMKDMCWDFKGFD